MAEYRMIQSMRWYGPQDPVPLYAILQAGCTHVVTSLHHLMVGEVWPEAEIVQRKNLIEQAGLLWTVVESLPVHEDIRSGKPSRDIYIQNYIASLKNLHKWGIRVVTYNFMPLLDWIRTDVSYKLTNGAEALYFCKSDFAAFDLFMLERPDAYQDYPAVDIKKYKEHYDQMSAKERERIFNTCLLGLPGSDIAFTKDQVLSMLENYKNVDRGQLKANLIYFLNAICPVADALGLEMAIHPDDPPYTVLGLPRIMSTQQDALDIIRSVPNKSNGFCFCTGSFGARSDNDIPSMIDLLASRIYFLHLRNTKRDEEGNFFEANHLEGDTDMVEVVRRIVRIMRKEQRSIPMRPDHGHKMLDDLEKKTYPGYSAIGRLKGLAELRGVAYAMEWM